MTGPKEERPDAAPVTIGGHWPHYFSISCMHGLHHRCRDECKFCPEKCRCHCPPGEGVKLVRRIRMWWWERRHYPGLAILPDGTVVRMKDGSVVGKQDPPR